MFSISAHFSSKLEHELLQVILAYFFQYHSICISDSCLCVYLCKSVTSSYLDLVSLFRGFPGLIPNEGCLSESRVNKRIYRLLCAANEASSGSDELRGNKKNKQNQLGLVVS